MNFARCHDISCFLGRPWRLFIWNLPLLVWVHSFYLDNMLLSWLPKKRKNEKKRNELYSVTKHWLIESLLGQSMEIYHPLEYLVPTVKLMENFSLFLISLLIFEYLFHSFIVICIFCQNPLVPFLGFCAHFICSPRYFKEGIGIYERKGDGSKQ